jgi:4-oxalocrotonate tautomerase
MPHVIIKMHAGRSQEMKQRISEAVTKAIMTEAGAREETISVSIQDFAPAEWTEKVYGPDIERGAGELFKRPGYGPMAASKA